jgi:hypothetical protein
MSIARADEGILRALVKEPQASNVALADQLGVSEITYVASAVEELGQDADPAAILAHAHLRGSADLHFGVSDSAGGRLGLRQARYPPQCTGTLTQSARALQR